MTLPGRVSFELHRRFLDRFVQPGHRELKVSAGPGRFATVLAGLDAPMVVTDFSPVRLGLNRPTWGALPLRSLLFSTGPRVRRKAMRCCLSLALMTDGLYVVAVRIAHEGSEVVRVVLGPQARLVKYLSTAGNRGIEKRSYRLAIGCGERDMRLAKALPGDLVANPELWLRLWSVADCRSKVHDPLAPQWSQDFVVETRAGAHVGALDGEMVEHPAIMAHNSRRRHSMSDITGSVSLLGVLRSDPGQIWL